MKKLYLTQIHLTQLLALFKEGKPSCCSSASKSGLYSMRSNAFVKCKLANHIGWCGCFFRRCFCAGQMSGNSWSCPQSPELAFAAVMTPQRKAALSNRLHASQGPRPRCLQSLLDEHVGGPWRGKTHDSRFQGLQCAWHAFA